MFHKKLAMLFIMTSLLTFAASIADAQDGPLAIVTEGLVSYWTFDEVKKTPQGKDLDFGQNERVLGQKTRERENGTEKGTRHCLVLNNGRSPQ